MLVESRAVAAPSTDSGDRLLRAATLEFAAHGLRAASVRGIAALAEEHDFQPLILRVPSASRYDGAT